MKNILFRGDFFEIDVPNSNNNILETNEFMLISNNFELSVLQLNGKYKGFIKWYNIPLEKNAIGISINNLKKFLVDYYKITDFNIKVNKTS